MRPYVGVDYSRTLCRLQSRLNYHIPWGQPCAKVCHYPMPESTLYPSQVLRNWPLKYTDLKEIFQFAISVAWTAQRIASYHRGIMQFNISLMEGACIAQNVDICPTMGFVWLYLSLIHQVDASIRLFLTLPASVSSRQLRAICCRTYAKHFIVFSIHLYKSSLLTVFLVIDSAGSIVQLPFHRCNYSLFLYQVNICNQRGI